MTGKSDFTPGAIDNSAGVIHTSFGTQQGPTAVPKGISPMFLAEIVFRVIQPRTGGNPMRRPVRIDGDVGRLFTNLRGGHGIDPWTFDEAHLL
jgi:hypothetical protein